MSFKNKNVVRKIFYFILLIFVSIAIYWLGIYAKFYYSIYYGGGVYIDSYVEKASDSRLWIGLPGMEKYCTEEGFEKGDVNCKPNPILKPKFDPGIFIDYPEGCLEERCNLDISEYNFDFCFYQEIEKTEGKQIAETIVFYTKRIFYSDVSITREHYYFKENCEFLEGENISDGKPFFGRKNIIISAVGDAISTKNNHYIPGMEKYCIEKGMNQYDINCYDWISEDSTIGIGVKYKQGFLYENEYLYEEDECIYNYFLEKKVIQSYDDIIFYPEYYKMNDTDFYKQDLIDNIGC